MFQKIIAWFRGFGCERHEWIHATEDDRRFLRCLHCLAETRGWR